MLNEIQSQINSYAEWIKSNTFLRETDDCIEITTPFIDRHNDHIQLYINKDKGKYYISDDAYTLSDLSLSGVDILKSEKRKKILHVTLNGFGIKLNGEELFVEATERDFPQKKHQLIQAILAVNDMFYLSRSHVASLFLEDVFAWFAFHDIRGTRNINILGKSGFYHSIDFSIPSSQKSHDRFVKIISKPNKGLVDTTLFTFYDILGSRENFLPYVILNDEDSDVKPDFITAFNNYNIKPIVWSNREEYINELVA